METLVGYEIWVLCFFLAVVVALFMEGNAPDLGAFFARCEEAIREQQRQRKR